MKKRGLYAIVDPALLGAHEALALTEKILHGGVACLQLRAKLMPDRDRIALARAMLSLCRKHDVPFVMNDRLDLALLVGADGVHLGQDDLPMKDARALAPTMQIGISTHSLAQALEAEREGADLIGFGPIFTTTSKDRPDPTVGLTGLAEVVERAKIPVVAIGGITEQRAPEVARTRVPFIAVISALSHSDAPDQVARRLNTLLTSAS